MVTNYFIDTNLILGFCNHQDKHHNLAQFFLINLNKKVARRVILLNSIEQEFNRKIQEEMTLFINKIRISINNGYSSLKEIQNHWSYDNENFENFLFELVEKQNKVSITLALIYKIQFEYYDYLEDQFDDLTKLWIKWPHVQEIGDIKQESFYITTINQLRGVIHSLDREHIAFAKYRASINTSHHHVFFTLDKDWDDFSLLLIQSNFKIVVLSKKVVQIGSEVPAHYSLLAHELLKDRSFCIMSAFGRNISKIVKACLMLKNNLLGELLIFKSQIDSKIIHGKVISKMQIYLLLIE